MNTAASAMVPKRIETPRLVLRLCYPSEAGQLHAAIHMSLSHLRTWLPWAMRPPASIRDAQVLIEETNTRFSECRDFVYTIFDSGDTQVYGGAGIHRRAEHGCFEIGYWIRADQTRKGYATEAVAALTSVALRIPGATRIQIDCDPRNLPSVRIPEKLGYRYLELRKGNKATPGGAPRDTAVFEITADDEFADYRPRVSSPVVGAA